MDCLHLFKTKKNRLELHQNVCGNKDFCSVAMPSEDTKILEFNQYQKSDETPSVICEDLESLIKK